MTSMASKPFSISFGSSKPKSAPPPAPNKRPHSALADPDSDHEDDSNGPQLVSGFGQSGAVVTNDGAKQQAPLIIQAEKNRDWREESRKKRRKNLLPAEVQAAQSGQNGDATNGHVDRDEVSKVSGIQFVHKDENAADGDVTMSETQAAPRIPVESNQSAKSADEEALEALLGGEKKSTLQIPAPDADDRDGRDDIQIADYANEDDRFRADVKSRPDVASLEEYAAVPVEDFGAALLRGMGWKDGEAIGKRRAGMAAPKAPIIKERRPALLGIGAKEVPGGAGDELGAWGKALKSKRKPDLTYNPVLLKNSKTGEMLTEAELAKKIEDQKTTDKDLDWRERRDKNLRLDYDRKSERRHRAPLAIEDGRNGDRDSEHRRRDRSRSKESRRQDRSRDDRSRRDRSRESDRRRRDRSPKTSSSKPDSSRRRSRSKERSHRDSPSRRERSRSAERRHRRY